MSLQALQATLARLLTDAQYRDAALHVESAELPPDLQGLDAARVDAFARQLTAKRLRALRRALPLTVAVLGAGAEEWLERYVAVCPPSEGPPGADAERFARFEGGLGGAENVDRPAWLPDLARYESARYAVRRAPMPTRRERSPLGAGAHLALGPATRVLDLAWDIPASLRSEGKGQKAKGKGQKEGGGANRVPAKRVAAGPRVRAFLVQAGGKGAPVSG